MNQLPNRQTDRVLIRKKNWNEVLRDILNVFVFMCCSQAGSIRSYMRFACFISPVWQQEVVGA